MIGDAVTFWYKAARQFGHIVILSDGSEVITLGDTYTTGWHIFKSEVDDLRVIKKVSTSVNSRI